MRRAAELLPGTRARYQGPPMGWDDMRVDDAREAPDAVRAVHDAVTDAHIAGVHCTWLDPGLRGTGVLVSLHGGGYVVGPGPAHWGWLSAMCRATGRAGLLVRYTRAPEACHPTARDEVLAVLAQAVEPERRPWWLVGDSAGGGLALAVAQALRDAARPLPAGMVLSSPWLDLTMQDPEMLAMQQHDVLLGVEALDRYAAAYAGATNRTHPHISPRFADPTGLPPMLITAGGAELFAPELRAWGAACQAAGTPCTVIEVDDAVHDFAIMLGLMPEADEVLPVQVAFLS